MSHKTAKINFTEWKSGDRATMSREDCIEAHCYECSGQDSDSDCGGKESCILYQYSQYAQIPKKPKMEGA